MDIVFWILMAVLIAILASHIAIFIVWITGRLNLSNFFRTKTVWLFFIPIVGAFAFLVGAVIARIKEDF